MRYVRYTYVDVATKIPVSQEPAVNGPSHPEGITPTFAIESSYSTGEPVFYGIVEEDFTLEDWMAEEDEDSFFEAMRGEFKRRAREKCSYIEEAGALLGGQYIPTTKDFQARLNSAVSGLSVTAEAGEVELEYAEGEWTTLSRDEVFEVAGAVFQHTQRCSSWCKSVCDKVDNIETLDDALVVIGEISNVSYDTLYPEQEDIKRE